jgi:hypothetical protein
MLDAEGETQLINGSKQFDYELWLNYFKNIQ